MKRVLIIVMLISMAYSASNAQSATSKVTIGASYVTTSLVDVYPFQSGKPGLGKIDYSVHFKMKLGIKFRIDDLKDSVGTTLGYVIVPWKFPADQKKSDSYKNIIDTARVNLAKQKKLRDSIVSKEAAIKLAKLNIQKDSIRVEDNKNKVLDARQRVIASENILLNSVVNMDIKKVSMPVNKKNEAAKNKIAEFKKVQAKAKSQVSEGANPSDTVKKQLLKAVSALPLKSNSAININKNKYNSSTTQLENSKQLLTTSAAKLENIKVKYTKVEAELLNLKKQFYMSASKSNENTPDPDSYKITKEEKNEKLDTPSNPASEAAIYSNLRYLDSWANDWQFFISAKDFTDKCIPIFPKSDKFTWGFLTLPVKMRFDNDRGGNFNFEQNLNFGLTFGRKHQLVNTNDISLNYLAGLSVVTVPLDNATTTTPATSTTAISASLGFMFQYNTFQIGAFLGRDFAGSHADEFRYQGKPWLGFAIGISLFGEGKATATAQSQ